MPRDSGGNFNNAQAAFVPQTTARAQDVNAALQDLGNAVTDSLSRSGKGDMLAPLRATSGSAANPSISFTDDPGMGLRRSGSFQMAWGAQAATIFVWDLTFVQCNRPLTVNATTNDTTALVATGTGTGSGASFTGGNGAANQDGGRALVLQGGTGSGTGFGGEGVRAVGGTSQSGFRSAGGSFVGGINSIGAEVTPSGQAYPNVYNFKLNTIPGSRASDYAAWSVNTTVAGIGSMIGLNLRFTVPGTGTITDWMDVEPTLSHEVENNIGLGGQVRWSKGQITVYRAMTDPATASSPKAALTIANGGVNLQGVAPGIGVAVKAQCNAASVPKAWALIRFGGGTTALTLVDGLNVASVSLAASVVTVTFPAAGAFASADYGMSGTFTTSVSTGYALPVERFGAFTTTTAKAYLTVIGTNGQGQLTKGGVGSFNSGDILELFFYGRQ